MIPNPQIRSSLGRQHPARKLEGTGLRHCEDDPMAPSGTGRASGHRQELQLPKAIVRGLPVDCTCMRSLRVAAALDLKQSKKYHG